MTAKSFPTDALTYFVRRALLVSSGVAISVLVLAFFVSWPPAGAAEKLAFGAATLAIAGLSFGVLELLLDRRHIVLYFQVAESVGRDEIAMLGRLQAGDTEPLDRLRGESPEGRWTPSVLAPHVGLALSEGKARVFVDASEGLAEIPGDFLIETLGHTFFLWHRYPSITLRESTSGSRVTFGVSRPRLFQVGPVRARDVRSAPWAEGRVMHWRRNGGAELLFDGSNQLGAPRTFDVYRLRSRGSHRGSLESFTIVEGPPDLLTLELSQTWPEPHGSDVVGGPFPVVLETGWNAFIGYCASLDDVDASPRRLWKVPDSPPTVREVDARDAMEPDRFREVVARLRVDPATDDADSVAERLASELDESRIAAFWARFQLETGDHLTDSGTVESRSNDAGIYRAAERALGSPASAGAKEWGERFLDVAERAASRLMGGAVEYSFISEGQRYQAEPESFSTDLHPLLVAGYFRGRYPGGRSGEEFFYVFGSTYYSGGAYRYPESLARAEAERVLQPRGLELAGEPQFQQLATASLNSGPKIELHYVA